MSVADGSGIFGSGAAVIGANRQKKAAAQTKKDARELRQQGLDYAAGLDWEPELLSDHAATYQRSQSPMADAFLQSLIAGDNPGLVQGTRQGAPRLKAAAQRSFNQSTGGLDALRARQRAMETSTPWQPMPFNEPAITEQNRWQSQAPALARMGITPQQDETLRSGGVTIDRVSGKELDSKRPAAHTFLGGKTVFGHEMTPEDYRRLAEVGPSGDQEAIRRILQGRG